MAYKRAPIWLLWMLGLWLNIADSIMTAHIISRSDSAAELNPIMKVIIDEWGTSGMILFKGLVFFMMALLIITSRFFNLARAQRLLFNSLAFTDGFMLANVIWGAYCYQSVA